jgi:hypothetical protein
MLMSNEVEARHALSSRARRAVIASLGCADLVAALEAAHGTPFYCSMDDPEAFFTVQVVADTASPHGATVLQQ